VVGLKLSRGWCALAVLTVMLAAVGTWAWARSTAGAQLAPTAVLRVDTNRPGNEFAPGAVGLGTEAEELRTGHLTAARTGLVRLMQLLGSSVLRIGGNSVDLSWWTSSGETPPAWATNTVTPANLSVLRGLLTATGWRVLLGVDLGHFEPARAADEARFAQEILGSSLLGIEIGNEPNAFGGKEQKLRSPSYPVSQYLREVKAYVQAIGASAPGVAVYGPALIQKSPWLLDMGSAARIFTGITQHFYATSTCPGGTSAVPSTIAGLLSPTERQLEDNVLATLVQAGAAAGRPTRIGETNTTACLGSAGSPAFASALWALDWSLRAESSGASGLNFAGGFGVCQARGENPICASNDRAARAGVVAAQPEYYGLLAARQLEGGRFVPTSVSAPDPLSDLTTWATLAPDGTLKVAIDDLAMAGPGQPVSISVPGYAVSGEEPLTASSARARGGVSLGEASANSEGRWKPRAMSVGPIVMRPASAMIVTLRLRARKHAAP